MSQIKPMSSLNKLAYKLKVTHQITKPNEPFNIHWYVWTNSSHPGLVTGFLDWDDKYHEYELEHPGEYSLYIPMDGQWRSIEPYKELIQFVEMYQNKGYEFPWLLRRGNGFCILDYYDNEGNVK